MTGNGWDGKRPNQTGRPHMEDKRIRRGITFNAAEWGLITAQTAKRDLSIREYLFSLAEADGRSPTGD